MARLKPLVLRKSKRCVWCGVRPALRKAGVPEGLCRRCATAAEQASGEGRARARAGAGAWGRGRAAAGFCMHAALVVCACRFRSAGGSSRLRGWAGRL